MRIVRASQKVCKCFFMQREIVQGKTPNARRFFRDFILKFRRFRRGPRCNSRAFVPQRIAYLAFAPLVYANVSAVLQFVGARHAVPCRGNYRKRGHRLRKRREHSRNTSCAVSISNPFAGVSVFVRARP